MSDLAKKLEELGKAITGIVILLVILASIYVCASVFW